MTLSANACVKCGLELMQATPPNYVAAANLLRLLYPMLEASDRPKVARILVQCGVALHDRTLMEYVGGVSELEPNHLQVSLARLLLQDDLHAHMKNACLREVEAQPAFYLPAGSWEQCIVVCAGGQKLLKQLYCNLKSLEVFESARNIPIVVVHAAEVPEGQAQRLQNSFPMLDLNFFDLTHTLLVMESELTAESLRGFQIKMAALVAIPARRVLLMDADLLWIQSPTNIIDTCREQNVDAHLFADFWHFLNRRHEKTSSTSFLYQQYGVDFDRLEFESGAVYFDREQCYKSIAMLRHMTIHHDYYFSLTFGDKDLYYLTLAVQGRRVTVSPLPQMLGNVRDEKFYSQSMLQSFNGSASHIHTTLHPLGDADLMVPDSLCADGSKIHFVQRVMSDGRNVCTVACDTELAAALPTPNIFSHVYLCALRDLQSLSETALF